jgi:hypothetical protein
MKISVMGTGMILGRYGKFIRKNCVEDILELKRLGNLVANQIQVSNFLE